jgi:hypothetical protein
MVEESSGLVILIRLVDRLPMPGRTARRGRPRTYSDRLILKA